MSINDVYQAVIGMNVKGQKIANVLHFEQTSGDGVITPNHDLCLAIQEDLLPTYQLTTSNDLSFESIRAHKISPAIGGTYVLPIAVLGLIAQDTLPPNGNVVATLYSDNLTRQGRGRIFISGVPDTVSGDGRLNSAAVGTYVTFLDLLMGTIQAAAGATFRAGVWSTVGLAFHDFTSYQIRARINTLRSRRMENP